MNINVYHKTVPNAKNPEKIEVLKNFAKGVRAVGDNCNDINDLEYHVSDVGVLQGWISNEIGRGHLKLRNLIIKRQLAHRKHVVAIDSNLFLYKNKENPKHYLRYSFDGIFPDTGNYCDSNIDPLRWNKISNDLGLSLKDYRHNGNHILVCLQRNGGWSMGGVDVQDWAIDTIVKIRLETDRPIVIRGHPGDKRTREYLNINHPSCRLRGVNSVTFSKPGTTLQDDLKNCWAVVNHNSSPVVGAAIEGYPIFVTDPGRSQCKEIANTDFRFIENPSMPDRQSWAERISMFHWNFDELRSGECWSHMRKYI